MLIQNQKLCEVLFGGMMYIKVTYGELRSSNKIDVCVCVCVCIPFHRTIFQAKISTSDILYLFLYYYSTVNFKHKLHDF
jgi:hypothetical protein